MNSACMLRFVRLPVDLGKSVIRPASFVAVSNQWRITHRFLRSSGTGHEYYWKNSQGYPKFAFTAAGLTMAAASVSVALELDADRQKTVEKADVLYKEQKFDELVEFLLKCKEDNDPEVLWRLSRGLYEVSKGKGEPEKEKLIAEALAFAEAANEIDGENFAIHKWLSILVDAMSNYGGLKQRITESKRVQFHMKKACELKPTDGTSWHLLGLWCYTVADIPWYQRKVASTFVATPPEATFKEALEYFLRAEEVEPNFYSRNQLFIGKSYLKLGEKVAAKAFLEKAAAWKAVTDDDKRAIQEAVELLKKL